MERLYFSGFEKILSSFLYTIGKTPGLRKFVENRFLVELSSLFFVKHSFSPYIALQECSSESICIDVLAEYISDLESALIYLDLNLQILKSIPRLHNFQLAIKPSTFINWIRSKDCLDALNRILTEASCRNVPIIFDAEDRETNQRFLPTLMAFAGQGYLLGSAFQCYWVDTKDVIDQFTRFKKTFFFRLVKGAYYSREASRHSKLLFKDIQNTTENLLQTAVQLAKSGMNVAVGSHDLDLINQLKPVTNIELQFLYGVGNGFYRMFNDINRKTRLYTPFYFSSDYAFSNSGGYLLRRLQENTDPYGYALKLLKRLF